MIEGYAVPDFVSDFWHLYIVAATVIGIVGTMWFLKSQTTRKLAVGEEAELMHPTWDGDLQEFNNPLPRWWLFLFWFLLLFSVVYLVLYPGLGKFGGIWNWSSADAYKQEKERVDGQFNEVLKPFMGKDLMAVSTDPVAKEMGQRLFLTYCSQCHGSDAKGSKDFPDLTDANWLFGGSPDDIKASIHSGRIGEMPGGLAGDEKGAKEVANYVLQLGGQKHDAALADAGKGKWAGCAGCHGEDGKGNNAAGFPNLTDGAWMYGGSEAAIVESIVKGRKGGMPAQEGLGEAKVHLLAAYVWGLGGGVKPVAPAPAPAAEAAPASEAAAPAVK